MALHLPSSLRLRLQLRIRQLHSNLRQSTSNRSRASLLSTVEWLNQISSQWSQIRSTDSQVECSLTDLLLLCQSKEVSHQSAKCQSSQLLLTMLQTSRLLSSTQLCRHSSHRHNLTHSSLLDSQCNSSHHHRIHSTTRSHKVNKHSPWATDSPWVKVRNHRTKIQHSQLQMTSSTQSQSSRPSAATEDWLQLVLIDY